MNTQPEDQLRRALRSQAERGAPHEIEIDAVTATARGIRRRRTAAAAISTAAVVALAVPAGMALTGTLEDDDPPVAGQEQPMEPPEQLREVALLDDVEQGGDPAGRPYVAGDAIVAPGGDRVSVGGSGTPVGVDPLGDQWLVLKDLGEGRYALDSVTPDGEVVDSVPAQSGPVLSEDGTVAAYVAPDGAVHTVTRADGDKELAGADELGKVGALEGVSAVMGSETCRMESHEIGECSVLADIAAGGVAFLGPHGEVDRLDGFRSVADATGDGVLGMVSADDFGSCSALQATGGTQRWRTCDNSFDEISPDGRWAIGLPAYLDGLGPRSISVVDMADGRERVRFADAGQSMSAIFDHTWESDSTVLLTVWDGDNDAWLLLRAGIDGSLTEVDSVTGAGDPLAGDGPPFSLG